MKNLGKIFSPSKRVIAKEGPRRRERVERRPMVEVMEPRALLSALETGVTPVIPSRHAGTAMLIPITESSPSHVVYQTNHPGGAIGLTRSAPVVIAPAAQGVDATTMDVFPADDSGGDTGDDGDGGDDDDGEGDDGDDENDPDPGQ
jgi:hypothetical protein